MRRVGSENCNSSVLCSSDAWSITCNVSEAIVELNIAMRASVIAGKAELNILNMC